MEDFTGKTISDIKCIGCAREKKIITQGDILKTKHFDLHQDFEVPIPGFLILATREHLDSIDDFSADAAAEYMSLLIDTRKFLRQECGFKTVYFFQNEDTSHHFHTWILPRYPWMEDKFGKKIQSVFPIMEYAKEHMKTSENLRDVENIVSKAILYFGN